MTAWLGRYCDLVLARPWLLLLASLLLVAVAGLGLTQLSYTSDYRVYFSKDNPERVALEAMENDFIRSESVLIAVAPQDGEVFHVDTLKALQTLTREGAKLPYARAAYSITNVYEAQAEGLNISTATIMPDLPLQAIDLQALKDRAMANDQLRNGLLSDSGDVAAVVVYIELPYDNPTAEVARVAEATEALADRVAAEHPGLQIHLTGLVMFNHALAEAFDRDFSYLYPAAYLVMFVLVGLFFRSWSSMAGTVAVVLMALLFANGMTGWLGIQLNTTSIASGIIILTLAVANCVHLLTTFTHERQAGQAPKPAMREALRVNFQPIFLTNLTTAIGFLCMNFSDAPPNQDLGNIVSIGIVAAFVFSISFLPALMMLIRLGEPHEPVQMQRMMLRLAEFVIAHRKPLFWGNLLVILALAACIPLNKFGDNYVEFFDDSIRFHNDAEFVNERLMGQQMLEYPIPAGGPGGVNEPEFQRQLEALGEWFAQQPETRKVTSMVDLMKNLNQTISGGDAAQYKLPETRAKSAQYLLFYEMSLPVGVDLTDIINIDKSAAKLTVMLDTISSEELIALDQRAVAWMRANLPESMVVHASGVPVMFAHVARRNFESMIVGTGLAFGLISTLLLLAFKSLRLGLISLVPNLVPAIVGFGVWGLLVGQAGMSLAVVVSLTLGIVVDDTVHLLSKYRRAREERGLSAEDAIRYAFSSVGMALWITSAVLVLGFCLIMISSFTLTVHLGALTAVVIACALLADFFFLPPLLMKLDSQQQSLAADR